jgi:D-serine deaminase-like pyridoxal phosphate-dependent protein
MEQNIKRLLDDVSELGISFRPHVKTLKVGQPPNQRLSMAKSMKWKRGLKLLV